MTIEEAKSRCKLMVIDRNYWSKENQIALNIAIKALDKCDKIEQIINDWNDVPWGTSRTVMQETLLRIADVLEKE